MAEHCLFTLARLRHETALFDVQQLSKVYRKLKSTEAIVLALRIMGAQQNTFFLEYLIEAIKIENPENIRVEASAAIALFNYQETLLPVFHQITNDPSSHVKVSLIDNLKLSKKHEPLLKIAEQLRNDDSQWVRHRATLALFAVKGNEMESVLLKLLRSEDFSVTTTCFTNSLRQYQLADHQQHLQTLARSRHVGIKSIASRLLNDEDADSEIIGKPNISLTADQSLDLAGKQLRIITSRGIITIQLLTSAPFTSANFYQLAKSGYYDGLSFHRVVSNFVVQGGDPESTGQGGPGYSIREELYPVQHVRGTLGIATSGKDTGW